MAEHEQITKTYLVTYSCPEVLDNGITVCGMEMRPVVVVSFQGERNLFKHRCQRDHVVELDRIYPLVRTVTEFSGKRRVLIEQGLHDAQG